jgi:hypothetical protein
MTGCLKVVIQILEVVVIGVAHISPGTRTVSTKQRYVCRGLHRQNLAVKSSLLLVKRAGGLSSATRASL